MSSNIQPMTREHFIKRLAELCLRSGLSGFPANDTAQHILLKSAVLTIGTTPKGMFTEKEIDEKLKYWINNISQIKGIDHVTLRRLLVDAGYLTRNKDGSCYKAPSNGPRPELFDTSVEDVDVLAAIQTARAEIACRKSEYLEKKQANK